MCEETAGSKMAEIQSLGEYKHLHTEFRNEPNWVALTYKRGNWRWFYTDNILQVGKRVPLPNWSESSHEKGKDCCKCNRYLGTLELYWKAKTFSCLYER